MAITSAGAGSGLDLEGIIASSVAAKKAQLQSPVLIKQDTNKVMLSGLGQLKSAVTKFTDVMAKLSEPGAFNKRIINITQSKDDPILKVEGKADAANGQYNITVNQLAQSSRQEGVFDSATTPLFSEDGELSFTAGDKTFKVKVKAGDTLQSLRKSINSHGDNFGLTANIVNTANGKAKLVIDSGVSGDGNDLKITGSNDSINNGFVNQLTQTQAAQDAMIDVDGVKLKSDSNTFDDTIQGLKITVLRTSDTTSSGDLKSNKVDISTDKSTLVTQAQSFIDSYNELQDTLTALGKRSTMVDGKKQDDGGALEGDATTRLISSFLSNTLMAPSTQSESFSTLFEVGINMDKNGKLSLDKKKFEEKVDTNFDQVVALFGGEQGLAKNLQDGLKDYTKSGGLLAQRTDELNSVQRRLSQQEADNNVVLQKYEASLRAQYGGLDALLVKMNQSLNYLYTIQTNSN
ncbi:flagellar filament capping protein FliD [Aeromonas rivipollensis]|uniref:flagellar filament capping protein FliD n=1 Tax=Aeromonas rivipollensis TaxID=948519 RepID=UPI000FA36A5A|nr:flagellar filament capping protein FliD [Aeromonas rivipollensis]